ncbi:MAG: hypothetical protein ABJB74_03500 [Gemmatimonas sp.]
MNHARLVIATLLTSLLMLACKDKPPTDDQQKHIADVVASGGVVDSILPIPEQLARFRKTITDRPDTLRHASASIKGLVSRWTLAVASSDTAALNAMLLDRAEFAWLYYPDSKMSLPPYESPPQLLWGQMLATSEEGAKKILKLFSTSSFKVVGVNCPTPPVTEGANQLHEGCLVNLEKIGGTPAEGSYFGTIIERDGRFKFVSFANRI